MAENEKATDKTAAVEDSEMFGGSGLISKNFTRDVSRDFYKGSMKIKLEVEWSGFLTRNDIQEVMGEADEALAQIKGFLLE